MFGFSLAELVMVCLVAIIIIKPKDLPEVAHFVGRTYYKIRKLIREIKTQLIEAEKELGLDQIRQEFNHGMVEEEIKADNKTTKIIDINGNIHEVANVDQIRSDLTAEEIAEEIKKYNQMNQDENDDKEKGENQKLPKPKS